MERSKIVDRRESSVEEQYCGWIGCLKQAIEDGAGADVHFWAEMVAGEIDLVSPYHPLLWRESAGGREIIEVLGRALDRVNKDIRQKRFTEWDTPELYQAYVGNIQICREEVGDYLAQWAVGGVRYAELARLTA